MHVHTPFDMAAAAAKLPILVVGDLMLDETMRGRVHRISPEAPVPVVEWAQSARALGGAGNVAANLTDLGAQPYVCGAVGDDAHGQELVQMLRARGCGIDGVCMVPGRVTTHKLRIASPVQQMLRVDREACLPLTPAAQNGAVRAVRERIGQVRGVICSDYRKGFVGTPLMRAIIDAARAHGVPTLVDPKGDDYGAYRGAHVLTPNLHELEQVARRPLPDLDALEAAARQLLWDLDARAILVTCGKDGMVLVGQNGQRVRIAAQTREVYDVTGAGDTVIAAFGYAYFNGASLEESARFANAAAGLVVGKRGTATVSRSELMHLSSSMSQHIGAKCLGVDATRAVLADLQRGGGRVVMTNGCFDLLHAGHVRYLQAARSMGECLVVGLNTDLSVRQLKGPTRPLVPQAARLEVLAALACVDYLVPFDAPTPQELVAALQPDILVKGADYAGREVVGRDVVEARGGRVELVPLLEGQSTTALVDRILHAHGRSRLSGNRGEAGAAAMPRDWA